MPSVDKHEKRTMEEANNSIHSIHPCPTKMYHELRVAYLRGNIISVIVVFIEKFLNNRKVRLM